MKRTVPIKENPKNLQALLFMKNHKSFSPQMTVWNLLHNKTLRTSGRGSKGHFVGGANHGWNRKGRW